MTNEKCDEVIENRDRISEIRDELHRLHDRIDGLACTLGDVLAREPRSNQGAEFIATYKTDTERLLASREADVAETRAYRKRWERVVVASSILQGWVSIPATGELGDRDLAERANEMARELIDYIGRDIEAENDDVEVAK